MDSVLERFLARIWEEVLRIDRVEVDESFFDVGGDSLRGAILINHLQQALGEVVSMATIFEVPTIAGLAAHLNRLYPDAVARLVDTGRAEGRSWAYSDAHQGDGLVSTDSLEEAVAAPERRLSELAPPADARRALSLPAPAWLEQRGIDRHEVEAVLLREPSVADCAVLVREAEAGELEPVAYVVCSGPFSPERLREHLRARFAEPLVPRAYVPVSGLPLTPAGQLDEPALGRLAVVDDVLIRRWEEHLSSLLGVDEVAVLAEERSRPLPRLHLHHLFPQRDRTPSVGPAGAAVAGPETPAAVDDGERPMALAYGGPLAIPDDAPETLTEALLRTAAEHAEKGITYVRSDGSEAFESYPCLLERARRILAGLRERGLRAGDRTLLQLDALEDHYATFWACLLGGIVPATVAVPLSYGERNAVLDKLFGAWKLLGHPPVVASPELVASVAGVGRLYPVDGLTVYPVDELEQSPPADDLHRSQPDHVAFLQLTSGSTGVPKCIQELHRSIVAHAHSVRQLEGHTPDDVTLNWMPVDHVGALLMYHLKDTYLGAHQVQVKTDLILADPLRWLDLLEAHGVSYTWSPNFGYKLVADHLANAPDRRWDLSRMRFFMNAGEQVTLPVVQDFLARVEPFGVAERVLQPAYGGAETATYITAHNDFEVRTGVRRFRKSSLGGRLEEAGDGDDATTTTFIDLGPPIPGVELRIVDRRGELVPEGVIGRLDIRGPILTSGYLDNEEANREAFVGDGWLTLGDLGFLLDGRLTLTGREKETIIVRGVNLYCHEIEDVVGAVEGVMPTFAGACAVADTSTGSESLAVFFVPQGSAAGEEGVGEEGVSAEVVELVRTVRARVAQNVGISPAYVVPLAREDFPKTTSGKIQRGQLREALETGRFSDTLKALDLALESANTVPDWFYRRIWRRRERPTARPRASAGQRTLVLCDEAGLGRALAERERRHGPWIEVEAGPAFEVLDENHYRLDPASPEDWRRLVATLAREGMDLEEVVHLGSYETDAGQIADLGTLEAAQERGALSLVFCLQALAAGRFADRPLRLLAVSRGAQPVTSTEGVACEHGPLLGVVRTASQEWPWLDCRHLDLEASDPEAAAGIVLDELRTTAADAEVAYREGRRLVPRLDRVDPRRSAPRSPPFERGGLYLVTGGLGGLASEVARYLLEQHDARLLLVGRTPLPEVAEPRASPEAVAGRIASHRALDELGGEILYRSVDVGDPARLGPVVTEAEARFGRPLDGIVHLAGVFEERLLADETRETFMASLRAKVQGTWALHELTRDRPDCAFVTFSSANGLFGGFGAGAYAAANAFLDAFAHHRRRAGLPSSCLAWSLWEGVGMGAAYASEKRRLSEARGFLPVSPEQGLASLLAGLHHEEPHLLVGLDATRPHIGRHVDGRVERTSTLRAYFTSDGSAPATQIDGREVPDRFGTPSACEPVQIDELPLTSEGAVDRRRLAELGARAATDGARPEGELWAARTSTELEVAAIWADMLGLAPEQVGADDDLLALGASLLSAVQAMRRLNHRFGVELPLRTLFQEPTVAALALAVTQARAETEAFPLSSGQRLLWRGEQRKGRTSSPHGTTAMRLCGPLDVAAIEASIDEICVRHEALRTTYETREGKPVQVVRSPQRVPLTRVELGELPPRTREQEARRLLAREAQRPFDLSRDPMLRAALVRLDDEEQVLLVVVHHIACDAWSLDVLWRELEALYGARRSGRRASLPELGVQYVDYAVWEHEQLRGGVLGPSMAYWRGQLADAPATLDLPTDRPSPPKLTSGGAWEELELPASLPGELEALCHREGVTVFMALLAVWVTLLHRCSGQDDLLVMTPFANRHHRELEGLIGFFANTLMLRHDLSGDPPFSELLGRVRDTAVDAFAHDQVPYEDLIHEFRPKPRAAFHLRSVAQALNLDDLRVERIDFDIDRGERWPFFSLVVNEGGRALTARLYYDTDRFEGSTARRMLGLLRLLLETVVVDPGRRLSELGPSVFDLSPPGEAGDPADQHVSGDSSPLAPPNRAPPSLRHVVRRARRAPDRIAARIKTSLFSR